MTGICYFANDEVEYFAEQQVNSIVNNIDDGARLIRESDSFSPELVDNLIEEAVNQKCDKLVLMVESKKYNQYKQVIPEVYGDMFESIEVVPENFVRVRESNNYDYYDGMEADAVFWADKYDEYVDAGMTDPDDGIVGFVAGKIDEEHPSDSPEQYASLERWVMSILKEKGYFKMPWMAEAVMRENDTAARGAQSLPQNGQTQQAKPVQQNNQQPFNDASSVSYILCDAAHINLNTIKAFDNDTKPLIGKFNLQNVRRSFTTVDSARLEGAALKSLLVEYPKKVANLETVAQQMSPDAPDFSLEADVQMTLQAFLQKAGTVTQKVKDAQGNEVEQQVNTGTGANVNIFAPTKQYQYLMKAAGAYQNIRVFNLGKSYENQNNQKINQLMEVLLNTDKELKCTGKEEDWVAAQKEGKNNLDMQFINYVRAIMKFMNEYANCDRRKPHDKSKRESELMKALKAQLMKWSGVDNAKKELSDNSAIAKFAIETFDKVKDAAKKDLQGNEKDKNKGMFDEKQAKDRNPKNIFMWEHYAELRKLLIDK